MSQMIDFTVPSTVPGRTLHAFRCVPDGQVRAIVQLSHGMVEFIDRYKPLAEYLAARGILVTGHDHLGHGGSIRTKADYGYFAQPDGNRAVLDDLHAMTVLTKTLYPDVPYFLLGHSMGSFYARQYLCEWGSELSGAIIMGTGFQPKALVQLAKTICRVLAVFFGWQHRSKLVASLSFTGYNKGLEGRTPLHVHVHPERLLQHVHRHPAAVRPSGSGPDAKRPAPAFPGRRRRPGGRTGQRRPARH